MIQAYHPYNAPVGVWGPIWRIIGVIFLTIKRFLSLILILAILVSCLPIHAFAAAPLISELINLFIALCDSWNITLHYNSGSDPAWAPVTEWVGQKLDYYLENVLSTTFAAWSFGMTFNSTTTGRIWVNNPVYKKLVAFANWLTQDQSWGDGGDYGIINKSGYFLEDGTSILRGTRNYMGIPTSLGTLFLVGSSYTLNNGVILFSTSNGQDLLVQSSSYSGYVLSSSNWQGFNYFYFSVGSGGSVEIVGSDGVYVQASDGSSLPSNPVISTSLHYSDLLGVPTSIGVSVATGVIGIPSDQAMDELDPAIGALIDIDGASPGMDVPAILDLVPAAVAAGDLSVSVTDVSESDISDDLAPDYGSADNYEVQGLQDVFPFCIPFDLYSFFSLLAAAPEVPIINLSLPIGQSSYSVTLDFTSFDSIAALVRRLELLGFIVFLMYETRNIIRS